MFYPLLHRSVDKEQCNVNYLKNSSDSVDRVNKQTAGFIDTVECP